MLPSASVDADASADTVNPEAERVNEAVGGVLAPWTTTDFVTEPTRFWLSVTVSLTAYVPGFA